MKETIKKYTKIPKELDEYVNDYNIYVFDIPRLSREEVEQFKSDFRIVADFFVQTKKGNYVPSRQKIQHKDGVLKFLSVFSNTKNFEKIVNIGKLQEVNDMCEVMERIIAEARIEGKTEGAVENTIKNLKNLMVSMNWSLQQAMVAMGLNSEEQRQYSSLMKEQNVIT